MDTFRHWIGARAPFRIGFLSVGRRGVVNQGFNAPFLQVALEKITTGGAGYKEMPDVALPVFTSLRQDKFFFAGGDIKDVCDYEGRQARYYGLRSVRAEGSD